MLCLLLLFYTVESLWRERRSGLASISLATPVRTGTLLLGKLLAKGLIAVAVVVPMEGSRGAARSEVRRQT
jgi:ABC-type transport system involved in multi-copper enzyme maturation permease subunit